MLRKLLIILLLCTIAVPITSSADSAVACSGGDCDYGDWSACDWCCSILEEECRENGGDECFYRGWVPCMADCIVF